MRSFRKKGGQMARVLWLRLLTIGLLIIFVLLLRGGWGVYQKERETRKNQAEAEAILGELQGRKNELQKEVSLLKTDRGIEGKLREQFEVAREGEGMIVIVDREAPESEVLNNTGAWWQALWPW